MERSGIQGSKPDPAENRDRTHAGDEARRHLLSGLPVTEQRLRLGGITTAVLQGGDGPSVILLHGPGEYAAKWLRVIPDLVKTHHVVAPDLPGHGASEGSPGDSERMAGWLEALIETTCPEPPALVGQILGGGIAARFAVEHSVRLNRLVLVDSLGLVPFHPDPDFGKALMTFLSEPTEDNHDRFWDLCAFDLDGLQKRLGDQWGWIKAYNLHLAASPERGAVQQALMERFGMMAIPEEDLARISVPTTMIWGRNDLATRLQVAREVGKRRGWPVHVIDNAADDPPLEQPEAFLKALRGVLG